MNIFESIANLLKGGNNAKRVGNSISRGHGPERRVLHTVQAVSEQAISDFRGIRVLAAECANERSRDSGSLPADPVCRESKALISAAIRFIDPIIGFKPSLLTRLKGAIESEDLIPTLVADLYCV